MDSANLKFVLFGLVAALVSNFSRTPVWRSIVLFAASILFLALLAPNLPAMFPLLGFLVVGYVVIMLREKRWKRSLLWGVATVILVYVWLKKYTFIPEPTFLPFAYFTLGLSYIFFRVLHLIIEAGEDGGNAQLSFRAYLLYTLNFTTFVSGPIARYDEFARDQFAGEPPPLNACIVALQLDRIVRGYFKVNIVALLLDDLRINALSNLDGSMSKGARLIDIFQIALIYPLFLYCNFSGYIDIVISVARLMRVRLPENFNRPFSAASFIEFWSRWHITLSNWLKTYVYNPLLMTLMRRFTAIALEPFLGVLCFFVTFFLVGLWHGRTSEFLFFGILQGGGVAMNKLWQIALNKSLGRKGYRELSKKRLYIALSRGLTFTWFAFTLFWFWGSWKQLNGLFSMLSLREWMLFWLAGWVAATGVLSLWEWLRPQLLSFRNSEGPLLTSRYARVVYASAMVLAVAVVTILLNQPAPEIVYKAF